MRTVVVHGRFSTNGQPVQGKISFRPSRVWVEEMGVTYPTMAPEVELDNGRFTVELTPTDAGEYSWSYLVTCPLGSWTIKVTEDGPVPLKDLLPKRVVE